MTLGTTYRGIAFGGLGNEFGCSQNVEVLSSSNAHVAIVVSTLGDRRKRGNCRVAVRAIDSKGQLGCVRQFRVDCTRLLRMWRMCN